MTTINITSLTAEDQGRKVIYHGQFGDESGTISSWNDTYIFVRFGNNIAGQSCLPQDLTFETER